MRRNIILLTAALLTACSRSSRPMNMVAEDRVMAAVELADAPPREAGGPAAVAGPRIAYSYSITYAFDRRTVAHVQGQQLALCRQLGPAHCLVVKSTLSAAGPEDHMVSDQAVLLIDAHLAGKMNQRLDALAVAGGAKLASRQVEAEDVTRQVIDTDARVRAKQALADRLLAIIKSGKGKVGELVEAERAYATTQEELDAARGEQAALSQRVAMSRVTIDYSFDDTPGGRSPVRASLATAGDTLAKSVAALVTAIVAALPWLIVGAIVVVFIRWVRRKLGWRWPRRARHSEPPAPSAN